MLALGTKRPEMRGRVVGALLLALLAFVSCRAGGDAALSRAPTARYTVKVDANEDGKSRMVLEGVVNFAKNFERYSQYYDGGLVWERIVVGQTEMTRRAERPDRWERAEGVVSGGADTFIALRHAVLAPARSVPFVESVADNVRRLGSESIRGHRTTQYMATVDLARMGAPSSRTVMIEFWTDDEGTTHRIRHTPFGHDRGVLVWDFTDFGLPVDLSLPPAEKAT